MLGENPYGRITGHLAAWIFGIFAWLAEALAAVGLYSVVSYTMAQRTNESGIRMVLGAQRGNLLRLVFASNFGSVGGGIVGGVGLSVALSTLIAKWAEANVGDPVMLAAAPIVLVAVAAMGGEATPFPLKDLLVRDAISIPAGVPAFDCLGADRCPLTCRFRRCLGESYVYRR